MPRPPRQTSAALLLLVAMVLAPASTSSAAAAWAAAAGGSAGAAATTMPAGPGPTVTSVPEVVVVVVVSRRYTVTWPAVTVGPFPGGPLATGYVVSRVSPSTSTLCTVTVTPGATGPYSCNEVLLLSDLSGPPTYRVAPRYENWTGPQGPAAS